MTIPPRAARPPRWRRPMPSSPKCLAPQASRSSCSRSCTSSTREGRLNQDSRRKLKQVYHLFQFIEQLLRELPEEGAATPRWPTMARASRTSASSSTTCSSAAREGGSHVYGIETRAELVEVARAGAAPGLRPHVLPQPDGGRIGQRQRAAGADRRGHRAACLRHRHRRRDRLRPRKKARCMVLVPCCRAEVAALPARDQGAWPCRARRWPSSGAIRCTRARSAASSPTCCAACTSKPTATASP